MALTFGVAAQLNDFTEYYLQLTGLQMEGGLIVGNPQMQHADIDALCVQLHHIAGLVLQQDNGACATHSARLLVRLAEFSNWALFVPEHKHEKLDNALMDAADALCAHAPENVSGALLCGLLSHPPSVNDPHSKRFSLFQKVVQTDKQHWTSDQVAAIGVMLEDSLRWAASRTPWQCSSAVVVFLQHMQQLPAKISVSLERAFTHVVCSVAARVLCAQQTHLYEHVLVGLNGAAVLRHTLDYAQRYHLAHVDEGMTRSLLEAWFPHNSRQTTQLAKKFPSLAAWRTHDMLHKTIGGKNHRTTRQTTRRM